MKTRCSKSIIFLALFCLSAFSISTVAAHEMDGIVGNSYITFLFIDKSFDLDIFTFETDGSFVMQRKDGTGVYEYNSPIFEAEWTSTDGSTTHNFMGVSLVSMVIIGWNDPITTSRHHGDWEGNFFVGIVSNLIPD